MSAWSRAARLEGAASVKLARVGGEFIRYGLCSAVALGCDMALLLITHHWLGLHYLLAAAIGFSAGLFVAYALSVRFAFTQRRCADARAEFSAFALIGALGLGLTQILLHVFVDALGFRVVLAKVATACFVFLFNFFARKVLLFTRPV